VNSLLVREFEGFRIVLKTEGLGSVIWGCFGEIILMFVDKSQVILEFHLENGAMSQADWPLTDLPEW
jgi:hypothetical protein